MGDLCSCWDEIHNVIIVQHNEIKASFETYGLPCACELARYDPRMIPVQEIHVMWTRLSFLNVFSSQSVGQLSIQREVHLLLNLVKEVHIAGKVTIKHKLLDIVCPSMTSMLPPVSKVKTKGGPKSHRSKKSTKCDPSYFEHVDTFLESSRQDTCVAKTKNKLKTKGVIQEKIIPC